MLRKTDGYFLLELLLSLSALFMVCIYLLPLLIDVREQSLKLTITTRAQQIMYEELQAKLINPINLNDYNFTENGIKYEIRWKESQEDFGHKEVCVSVEQNLLQTNTKVCEPLE